MSLNKCHLCKKYEAKPFADLPASPLPDFRAQCCDPYSFCGIDYLGPIFVSPMPVAKEVSKVHVVVYTCASTRAIHLDLVPDTTSMSLVNSLKRFIARRGVPKFFVSDNAKCFIGPETINFLKIRGIDWKFILEVAPNWGGFWERMVQTVKRPLRKILKKSRVNYDEQQTIINECDMLIVLLLS